MRHQYTLYRMGGNEVVTAHNGHRKYEGTITAEMVMDLFMGIALHKSGPWEYVDCRTIKHPEGETVTFND